MKFYVSLRGREIPNYVIVDAASSEAAWQKVKATGKRPRNAMPLDLFRQTTRRKV